MRESKRRNAARRREESDGEKDSELSKVIKQAFGAGDEVVPEMESASEGVLAAMPLSKPPEEVVGPATDEPDQPSALSRDRTAPETSASPMNAAWPSAEIQAPPPKPFHSRQSEVREPLPARMLNEFVYCPRLFYYEHVEGVFVENADTVRGAVVHARVDKGTGTLPSAQEEKSDAQAREPDDGESSRPRLNTEIIHSRSVTLGSERLGVIAKLDLVEVQSAEEGDSPELLSRLSVCPVDYKAGAPREGEDGNELWPTDRMQLGLQMLILRDNGYRCDRGIIYYRTTKQRVPLEWTPELEAWICAQVDLARQTMSGPIPPPLVGSPKCVRCSLNSVCLPDETWLLATRAGESSELRVEGTTADRISPASHLSTNTQLPTGGVPRRLMSPRDDTRVLYLNTPGVRVGRKDEMLTVKEDDKTLSEVRIGDLTHVALFGNIQISTQAIQALCEREIPVSYFSMGGWFYGITRGHELKNVFTRMEQFRFARDPSACLALARRMVFGKVRNHRTMLMRLHLEPPAPVVAKLRTMADSALRATSLEELLGTEGAAANFYFGAFAGMLKAEDEFADSNHGPGPQLRFNFSGRNRRPPTDPVNALLSLAYSLLTKDCTLAAMAVGLDPYVGFYHQPRFGRPALALDVMEEFRPLIAESVVLTAINNRMILPKHFVRAGHAVNLSAAGRKLFFQTYEQRMSSLITHPIFDYKVSYRRVLELQFRMLARYLTGEIPEYVPFLTR
ncbi:MAG TPA: CRISPR-associated endonuclease Cas1 [Terrimicrobiaceae bacterium]